MRQLRFVVLSLFFVLSGCTQFFFFPERAFVQTPQDFGYAYEDVFITTADGVRIHGWLVEPSLEASDSEKGVVYFLHGNAQNISWHIRGAEWLLADGYRVFAIDYRGYGKSAGHPDIPEVYQDITAGFDWLLSQPENRALIDGGAPLVLFGQSLGASLGMNWLAEQPMAQTQITHVLADSGFSRFGTVAREVADSHWLTWLVQYPAQWFLSDERDPAESISQLSGPIMLVHSKDDSVVSFEHSDVLLAAGGENVQRISAQGPHISAFRVHEIRDSVLTWLSEEAKN